MGCCVTKDENAFEDGTRREGEALGFSSRNFVTATQQGCVNPSLEVSYRSSLRKRLKEESSSKWDLLMPQVEEMHAVWIISMLRQLRSEVDTIYLLSRLMEIMELLDPLDGDLMIRKHMCESGAAEVLSCTISNHFASPDIVLMCIFLLVHIMFNDGVSEKMVPEVSLFLVLLLILNSFIF